jgi:hypothetical protein
MSAFYSRLTLVIVILLQFSVTVYAGPLDDYYLQQFGEIKNIQLQKALRSVSPEELDSARCGMPLKHGLRRDWNLLEQATQKVLAKQLALPVLTGEATFTSVGGHFKVHYATAGTDVPSSIDVNDIIGVPDWVETVAKTFEDVYSYYGSQGYQLAPTIPTGAPYDIYLRDLAPQRVYGMTNSDQFAPSASYPNAVTSWMELDNDFIETLYTNAFGGPYTTLQSLQITASHEYHHAVQYGYNFYFDVWYAEATSTWMEDDLYDNVNQLYNYIPAWFSNSTKPLDLAVGSDATTSGAGYGRWIFNRYLSEKHGPAMIRGVWEKVGGLPGPGNNADIPMVPVLESLLSSATYGTSLSADFFTFAKRVYTRDWTTHPSDTSKIHLYSPVATYSVYPVNSTVSSQTPSVALPHYSFAYYKFNPTSGVPSLKIYINKTSGIQTALFKKISGVTSEIAADASNTSYVASGLGTSDEVVLLIANTSSLDGHTANFSTDGSLVAVAEPAIPTSSTSGGSGCFIATAAYGSYLHPQVQLLRHFRDDYLMTNAPGRAFVSIYYRFSPPLAHFIARYTILRSMTRLALTPLVVAVAHPLISVVSLFLLIGTVLRSKLRRIKAARPNARPYIIRTT